MFPIIPAASAADSGNTNGIFYGGGTAPSTYIGVSNIVSNTGILQSDVAAVAGAGDVQQKSGCEYGADKGIHFGGHNNSTNPISITNLVSNLGVMSADVAGAPGVTARRQLAGCDFGGDKGIVGFGDTTGGYVGMSNLISNAGIVASDVAAVGTARESVAACEYSGNKDKGIFFAGQQPAPGYSKDPITNLVSNLGVIASDTAAVAGVGDAANGAGCSYGGDKGIFGFGAAGAGGYGRTNLVSNAGVIAADVAAVGTARYYVGACEYGGDKGIFGFGYDSGYGDVTNQVSDTGVVQSDVTGVGTGRVFPSGCSWG
tara:strand:- start:14 stop:958 length:945 start_codon:yes stop_codon:yes gene_type:complete